VRAVGVVALPVLVAPALAAALTLPPGFAASTVVRGLEHPTAAAFLPDGRLVALEKAGRVRLWTPDAGLLPAPALELPTCTDSEMGLVGVALDPEFATTRRLYLYLTHPPGDDPAACGTSSGRTNRLVRVRLDGDVADPASLAVLFDGIRTDGGNHDGGGLVFGPDGTLYVGVGDSGVGDGGPPGASTNPYAADPTHANGKVLRLTRDGDPVPGGPFAGRGGDADFVFARGFRNPWRLTFAPGTDLLWVADVGQSTWEEIDVVRAGDDLGWPRCEGPEPAPPCPGDSVPPIYAYRHAGTGASITGGVFYTGTLFPPAYRGSYFFGDYVLDTISRGVPTPAGDGFAAPPEVFARDAAAPVHLTLGPDGALYYVAFMPGEVRRIAPVAGAPGRCAVRLTAAAARWLRRAGAPLAACDAMPCDPPPARMRAASRALARRVRRPCAAPPAALCDALGCGACGDVAACATPVLAAFVADVAAVTAHSPRGACAARATREALRFAARRLRGLGRCARRPGAACTPAGGERRLRRRLSHACAAPPAAVCTAAGCATCDGPAALASCLAAAVAPRVDALARRLAGAAP
jgi:glucose/arabinose dehydrogenase